VSRPEIVDGVVDRFLAIGIDAEPAGIVAPVLEDDVPARDGDAGPPEEVSGQYTPVRGAPDETGTITNTPGDDE